MPMGMAGWARMNQMRNRALAAQGGSFRGAGALDLNSESTPPTTNTTPFSTVSNANVDWSRPAGGGVRRGGGFNPFSSGLNPYAHGVWNPGMAIGSQNIHGGTYGGLSYGPNEGGGFGWHTVFSPGGGSAGGGSNFGVTRNMPVGFGGFPSLGLLSQKFA